MQKPALAVTAMVSLLVLTRSAAARASDGFPVAADPDAAPQHRVLVEMTSDDPKSTLYRLVDGAQGSVVVCIPPCRKEVDGGFVYTVGGDGIRRSSSFVFPEGQSRVQLEVKTGSSALFATGVVLAIGGGGVTLYSLLFLALSSVASDVGTQNGSNPASGIRTAGLVGLGIGLTAIAGGLYLALTSKTTVTATNGMVLGGGGGRPAGARRSRFRLSARGLEF